MTGTIRAIAFAGCFMGIAVARGASAQAVPLDSAAAVAAFDSTCGAALSGQRSGMLRGDVRDADAGPVPGAAVTIAWRGPDDVPAGAIRTISSADSPMLGALSDAQGHWHICGAPLHTALSIRAVADEGSDERIATLDGAHPTASVDLSLRSVVRRGNAARPERTSALVVFSVEDRAGNALGGITLDIIPATGPPHRVVTDTAGRAIVPAVAPGRARVTSLAIGYRPGELFVPLDAGRNTVPLILDAARIPTLATVRVIGDREVLPRHQAFESRRSLRQTTASITAEDIEKRNPVDTWQMLTNIPSMRVMEYGAGVPGVFAMSSREQQVVQKRGVPGGVATIPCWYRVMLDGVLLPDIMPDLSTVLPVPSEVHGIEVFAGLATIPPQYNSSVSDGQGGARTNSCGLIAIWTK